MPPDAQALPRRLAARLGAACLAATVQLAPAAPLDEAAGAARGVSEAERLLFVEPHLAAVRPPAALRYRFRHAGSLDAAFEDDVTLHLAADAEGRCCRVRGDFLDGDRRLALPEIDAARANPVLLYFLERDVRQMERLTKGQQNHFRRRIRLALADGAQTDAVQLRYRGATVAGLRIRVEPYRDDAQRPRFERYADKRYTFLLSDAVPGGVYGIHTSIGDAAAPLVAEELLIEGAERP